jgi:hypothetical protein
MRPRNRAGAVTLVAVLAGAVAGCSSTPDGPKVQPSAVVATNSAGSRAVTLPVFAFLPTDQQLTVLRNAQSLLINKCMHRFGFTDYEIAPPPISRAQDRRYGVIDPAMAQKYGYSMVPGTIAATEPNDSPLNPRNMTRSELITLEGVKGNPKATREAGGTVIPAGGCAGEATRTIAPDGAFAPSRTAGKIKADSFERSQTDPAVITVFRSWSQCMAKSGYDYPDPIAAAADPRWNVNRTPSQASINAAVADVRCKDSTGLIALWAGVEARLQKADIEKDSQQLNAEFQDLTAQIKRASKVVAGQ